MKTFKTTLSYLAMCGLPLCGLCALPAAAAPTDNLTFGVGGFVKADALFIGGAVNSTDAPRWAVDEDTANDDTFTGTVQHSRLWLSLDHDKVNETGKLKAYVEADLFNLDDIPDNSKYNNNQMRVRQLWVAYDEQMWSLRVGQAWDVFSPLNPTSMNTNGNLWFGGNAGFRRPQVRFTAGQEDAQGAHLLGEVSLNANLAMTGGEESGQNSGWPVAEGRVSLVLPTQEDRDMTVGVFGLWGQEEIDAAVPGGADVDQWGFGFDFDLDIQEWLQLKGEFHWGENLDTYLTGGGVDTADGDELGSYGGWAQVILKLAPEMALSGYFGFEDIDDVDDPATFGSHVTENLVLGGQFRYDFFEVCTAGVELTHYDTDFQNAGSEKATAIWLSFLYNF